MQLSLMSRYRDDLKSDQWVGGSVSVCLGRVRSERVTVTVSMRVKARVPVGCKRDQTRLGCHLIDNSDASTGARHPRLREHGVPCSSVLVVDFISWLTF